MYLYWLFLALAILCEIGATTSMKLSAGFTKPLWGIALTVGYIASFSFITLALKKLPLGMSYAIWAGAGTAAAALIGHFVFREPLTPLKLSGIALVLGGVVLLRLAETS